MPPDFALGSVAPSSDRTVCPSIETDAVPTSIVSRWRRIFVRATKLADHWTQRGGASSRWRTNGSRTSVVVGSPSQRMPGVIRCSNPVPGSGARRETTSATTQATIPHAASARIHERRARAVIALSRWRRACRGRRPCSSERAPVLSRGAPRSTGDAGSLRARLCTCRPSTTRPRTHRESATRRPHRRRRECRPGAGSPSPCARTGTPRPSARARAGGRRGCRAARRASCGARRRGGTRR